MANVPPRPAAAGDKPDSPPELAEQLQELLGEVWRCEADWRFDIRLDAMIRDQEHRHPEGEHGK